MGIRESDEYRDIYKLLYDIDRGWFERESEKYDCKEKRITLCGIEETLCLSCVLLLIAYSSPKKKLIGSKVNFRRAMTQLLYYVEVKGVFI